MTFRIRRAWM